VPIRTDFRCGIRFELAVLRGAGPRELLEIWYDEPPLDRGAALMAALAFYCCGELPAPSGAGEPGEPAYDFEEDAGAILASFSAAYGIDLTRARLHWWTFRALLRSLPADSEFRRLTALRTADGSGLDREQRARLRRVQNAVRLRRGAAMSLRERDEAWRARVGGLFERAGEAHGA
jgi:hypothetical protein